MAHYEIKFSDSRPDHETIVVEADGFEIYPDSQPLVVILHNNVPRDVDPNANATPWLGGLGNTVRRQIAAFSSVSSIQEVIV